jgi:hypothetical protein
MLFTSSSMRNSRKKEPSGENTNLPGWGGGEGRRDGRFVSGKGEARAWRSWQAGEAGRQPLNNKTLEGLRLIETTAA